MLNRIVGITCLILGLMILSKGHAQYSIQNLPPVTLPTPNDLLPVAQPNPQSPVGYSTRSEKASQIVVGNGGGISLIQAGCVADGVTDQTACINNALTAAAGCVIVDANPLGFYVAGTVTVQRCLAGTVFNPSLSTLSFSGTSRIICNNQVAKPCLIVNNSGNLSAQIHDFTLVGSGVTPFAGSIGLQWQNGYNLILTNFQAANFDTCAYFGPTSIGGTNPISAHTVNTFFSQCQKHYIVNDGIPELTFIGGRWGQNGGDYNSADDFVFNTKTTTSGAAGGPNTLVIDGVQINPGGASIGCAFRWGNFVFSPSDLSSNKIANSHIEVLDAGYTGAASQGMFCTDSTVNHLPGIFVVGSELLRDGGTNNLKLFNFNAATPFDSDLRMTNNRLCGGASTLTIANEATTHGPVFENNSFCTPQTFAAGDTTADLTLIGNRLVGGTFSGQWNNLVLDSNIYTTPPTDSATGNVFVSNEASRSWTPTLTISGATIGYASNTGMWERTPSGGLNASFNITVNSLSGGSGPVTITGFPKTCGGYPSANSFQSYSNFASLTGAPWISWVGGQSYFNILEAPASSGTTFQVLAASNMTSSTSLVGTVICGLAQ